LLAAVPHIVRPDDLTHIAFAGILRIPTNSNSERGGDKHMEEIRKSEGLTLEELEEHTVELLPDREEMQVPIDVGGAAAAVQGILGSLPV
jgi:hypothetical protein